MVTKQEIIKLIEKEYIKSGNEFCKICTSKIMCSECLMLKAMIELRDKIENQRMGKSYGY